MKTRHLPANSPFISLPDVSSSHIDWIEASDLCIKLHISRRTLSRYCNEGKFAFSRLGNRIYFRLVDINRYLENNLTLKPIKPWKQRPTGGDSPLPRPSA